MVLKAAIRCSDVEAGRFSACGFSRRRNESPGLRESPARELRAFLIRRHRRWDRGPSQARVDRYQQNSNHR
jgi:hypothetical protein